MRHPSSRTCKNVVDLYTATFAPDSNGGPGYTYPSIPTTSQVRCSVQPDAFEIEDAQGRVTQDTGFKIFFTFKPSLKPRDKILWHDGTTTRTLFAEAVEDQAGRGGAWVVRASERQ